MPAFLGPAIGSAERRVLRTFSVSIVLAVAVLMLAPAFAGQSAMTHSSVNVATAPTSGPPTVTAVCAVGSGPRTPGFDPFDHDVYVPITGNGSLSVFDLGCNIVGTIALPPGAVPVAATFDPVNDRRYVANWSASPGVSPGEIWIIGGLTVIATITSSLLVSPAALLWDPNASMMLVSNDASPGSVAGIQGTTVVGAAGLGEYPQGMCYDPASGNVWVTDVYSDSASVLNASNPLAGPIANVSVPGLAWGCAFDPLDRLVYVTAGGTAQMTAFRGNGS
jgi:DNA-binding beta-propeller fold protein YncE